MRFDEVVTKREEMSKREKWKKKTTNRNLIIISTGTSQNVIIHSYMKENK